MKSILEQISGKRILVLGDVMLDRYWWGAVNRISPEAPVPVVSLQRETLVLGGAANVALNLKGLGVTPVLIGVIGTDVAGEGVVQHSLSGGFDASYLVRAESRPTTVKTRVIAHHQQIVRLDEEMAADVPADIASRLLETVRRELDTCDAVLLSDYVKGVLTSDVTAEVIRVSAGRGKPVIVDPKGKDYAKYRGAYILTPNHKETMEAASLQIADATELEAAGRRMVGELDLHAMLVTRGENGMMLVESGQETFELRASARDVYDVTGAGDTVIATLTAAIASGMCLREAATLANVAAGIVVEHVGTTAITAEMLLRDN